MENTANFVESPKNVNRKGMYPNRYNTFIRLNPTKVDKIHQFLRANGVTDAIKYNWVYERTKTSPVHEIIFDKMAKRLELIEQ